MKTVLVRFTLPTKFGAVAGFSAGKVIPTHYRNSVVSKIETIVIEKCGGLSTLRGSGIWADDNKRVVRERVSFIETVVSFDSAKDQREFVGRVATIIKTELRQDSVLVQVLPVNTFWY